MKMKKLLTAFFAVFVSIGLAAGTASAAPSASSSPTVVNTGNNGDQYVLSVVTSSESFQEIQRDTPAVAQAIESINQAVNAVVSGTADAATVTQTVINELQSLVDNTSLPESVRTSAEQVIQALQGKQAVTDFFDIDRTGEGVRKTPDGKYQVTIKVPSITTSTTGVIILHYSPTRQVWEIIKPGDNDVNLENQEVTATFEDLSPVMVLVDNGTGNGVSDMASGQSSTTASGSTSKGTSSSSSSSSSQSPQTGVTSQWGGYAIVAVVLAAAGVGVLLYRKRAARA